MMQYIPISLSGNTLGERHRYLNSLVNDAYNSSIPFASIQGLPEASPIDRLFKIDLASKHKDVNYIIQNLKDADLLYVSRALKCTWLLDATYDNIINPDNLNDELYAEMVTPAVSKTKHWIKHHLQDPDRCRNFYEYYKENEFEFALKFLPNCSTEYLLEEFPNIMTRIKPKQLKVLSEKCPQLTKIFYGRLKQDRDVTKHYLDHETHFLRNLKYLLKSDPGTFFHVLEKYYNVHGNGSFNADITEHIMLHHKDKFSEKPELYTVYLLDMKALAKCVSPEEAKDLVVNLAHAEYLESWFTYKAVEPLILRLDKVARVALKKRIFVNKEIGDKIKVWPYTLPTSPVLEKKPGYSLFLDEVHHYNYYEPGNIYLESVCYPACLNQRLLKVSDFQIKQRTLLDELFDHYRFASFENTFFELRTRLRTESSPQNRQFMMLVLVSKCGGRENAVRTLFGLLAEYKNEPVHLRAAIVRSLVKRAFVWRLPEDLWGHLLEWAHGLGLDGSEPEAACDEGLHAVVLRVLLASKTLKPAVLTRFLNLFTNFTDYSLNKAERCCVQTRLLDLLMSAADKETNNGKLNRYNQILDTLQAFKIPFTAFPSVINAIADIAQDAPEGCDYILNRLYEARAGRRQLFKVNFPRIQNNASYLNALRHDVTVLDVNKFNYMHVLNKHPFNSRLQLDQFLRKLIIYFSEDGGLAKEFYASLKRKADVTPSKLLARSLALLAGNDLNALLKTFEFDTKQRLKSAGQSLAAALRANAHVSRPPLDLNIIGWQGAGVKAVANVLSISPKKNREETIKKLITWKKALRLALAFTENEDTKCAIFKTLVTTKPGLALKIFLYYVKKNKLGDLFLTIWNEVKPLIRKLDYKNRPRLCNNLNDVSIPEVIKSEYYVLVYKVYTDREERKALSLLFKIENICSEVDEIFLYETLKVFLENDFKPEKVCERNYDIYHDTKCSLHIRLIAKFLLLCTSEEVQKKRLKVVGDVFFDHFEKMWKDPTNRKHLDRYLFEFLTTLKYNKVIFDIKYVSCMPVYERVVSWMQSILSVEKWFDRYVDIHLTMLYHKAARYCLEDKPEIFNTDHPNIDKGVEMFGAIFGKLVAHEFEELNLKYFQSIREIYKKELIDYFVTSLDYQTFDESKEKFAIAFVKSVLVETGTKEAHLLALHMFKEHVMFHFKHDYDGLRDIINILKDTNDNELKFNFEMLLIVDTGRCDKIKRYLDVTVT